MYLQACYVLSILLVITISLIIFLFLKIKSLKKEIQAPTKSIEAQEVLSDILSGGAILDIKVIDPGTIYFHR